ncbi:tigger transposable element-derived protein 6-like [Gigantopelta aegis]|uniref:tigger transposable element-derived protein 6-like n=1 Tax=Gigantopelta aegis TaxID=1735272 RepID=UPI001B88AC85|nr:tigger transposable element-derived protein 6-like [Gigantopelta aegis]
MTSQLFNDWLQQLNRQMRRQRRKILLFIDNAPSHGQDLSVSNVTVKFLPANTTSVLQPLDQGIIKAFKARYRKYLMRSLISRMEDCASVTELCKAITVLDAVNWINAAWKETQQTTIAKCFMMCGFPVTSEQESDDENDDNIPLATLLATISSEVPVAEFVNFDHDIPTEDPDASDWETQLVAAHKSTDKGEEKPADDSSDDDNTELDTMPELNYAEVLKIIKQVKNFAATKENRLLQPVLNLEVMTEEFALERNIRNKQTAVTDYFSGETR